MFTKQSQELLSLIKFDVTTQAHFSYNCCVQNMVKFEKKLWPKTICGDIFFTKEDDKENKCFCWI